MGKALSSDDAGADDKKIQAAASDGDGDNDDRDENNIDYEDADDEEETGDGDESGDEDEDEDDEDDKGMTKSFRLTLDDGTEVDAEDGTALVKAVLNRVEKNEETLTKALEATIRLIKSQGETIRSLESRIGKLSEQGRGRKAIVTMVEKKQAAMTKSDSGEGVSAGEFMNKALRAQAEGRITGSDVARAESYLNHGKPVPADIVSRVFD